MAVAILLLLGFILVRSIVVLASEGVVRTAERRIEDQVDSGEVALTGRFSGLAEEIDQLPPRAVLADAAYLARVARGTADPFGRRALIEAADQRAIAATRMRAPWGEAWTVRAFIASLRDGAGAPATRRLLARSYREAPFLRRAGSWRIAAGFEAWQALDAATRAQVLDEAVWLARLDRSARAGIFDLAAQSDAYSRFLLRWRAVRLTDPEFVTVGTAAP